MGGCIDVDHQHSYNSDRSASLPFDDKERAVQGPQNPSRLSQSTLLRYGIAVPAVGLALLATMMIRPLVGQTVFALFFLAVIASTWYGGLGPGLLAIALSIAAVDLLLLPPYGSLLPLQAFGFENLAQLGVVALTALLISVLTASRRRAEIQLAAERERLAVTLASIGDAVIATDARGQVTFLNAVAEGLTGWPAAEAQGQPVERVFQIINHDTRLPVESPVTRVLREGRVVGLANHTLLVARDGAERPIDDSGSPIRDAAGTIGGVVMVFRDISERAQSEALLARYQLLSEQARDIILFVDGDGRILEANNAAVAAYGYTHDELLGLHIVDLRDPETIAEVGVQMARADTEGTLFETRHRRKDGSCFDVEVSSRGATIDGQRMLLSIIRDIGARKQAEERLRFLAEAGAALSASIDPGERLDSLARLAVPQIADWCAIDILDDDGRFEPPVVAHADPAKIAWARELRGRYPIDLSEPRGVANVIRTGATEFYPEISDAMLQAGARDAEQLEIARRIGYTSAIIAPLKAHDRRIGAITFVTAESRRRYDAGDVALAEELARRAAIAIDNARLYSTAQQARAEAEAAVRLRDQFLSIAAHELNTPLTSLIGNAQLMQRRAQRDGSLPEREQRNLRVINDQAQRLNRMVLALLDIARLETGQLSIERAPLDIGNLTRRVVDEIRPAIDGRKIELVAPFIPLVVDGDELRLEQVLQNLIQNALKYSPEHQPIAIRVERHERRACVAISDRGIGIPEESLPALFQRFYRASNVEDRYISGMGVGLYVVKEIVELHSGEITVESIEGQGSTFTVCLPLAEAS
jgi:PAS domain S-box-containing protein